jgi:hypothetical protein
MRKGFFDDDAARCFRCSSLIGLEPIGRDTPLGPICVSCIDELAQKRRAREEASHTASMPAAWEKKRAGLHLALLEGLIEEAS